MKANTVIHMAVRNIGDSSDHGEFFEGTLRDGILWLTAALGSKSMATRFVIGIGRNRAGAEQGISLGRQASKFEIAELGDELDRLLGGDSLDEVLDSVGPNGSDPDSAPVSAPGGLVPVDSLDTWKGPTQ